MTASDNRVAGAPASWGVCEVPGWGDQLSPERVLAEMRDLGLRATELGPDGFIPGTPAEQATLLGTYGLTALGGFCPLLLHDRSRPPDRAIQELLDRFVALGAEVMVIAAATGEEGYDRRPDLDGSEWEILLASLERAIALAADRGVRACIHPHVGTLIETPSDVDRVLAGSDVPLCLDTGHLLVGGSDPVAVVHDVPERIAHVHLKDVDTGLLDTVRSSGRTYSEAVRLGMYRPLGEGDVDLPEIVRSLEASGYEGYYVPEVDRALVSEPGDGEGPVADMRVSVAFLHDLLRAGFRPGSSKA